MKFHFKFIILILSLLLIVSCQAKAPSSTKDSSTDSSTDTDTDTTNFVGKWIKSSNNSIAMDWKSNNFVYACLVGTDYTFAAHGSFSNSNKKLTWWDGTYNTVSPSGNDIILDGATYNPAILYSTCNPFWTYNTNENTYYTNAARSIGLWRFTFTIISTFNDYPLMSSISTRRASDNNYYTYGTNESGDIITGTYETSTGIWDILDTSPSNINLYYAFKINSSNSGIDSGWYYQYDKSTSTWSSGYAMTASKNYGNPQSYRTTSENSTEEIMEKRKNEMFQSESMRSNARVTNQDLRYFKRYQKLLQVLNSTEKSTLKKYLNSFRKN